MSAREAVARAMFASIKGDLHNTEWDFMKGPTNVDEETKDRYRRMADAAISAYRAWMEKEGLVVVSKSSTNKEQLMQQVASAGLVVVSKEFMAEGVANMITDKCNQMVGR